MIQAIVNIKLLPKLNNMKKAVKWMKRDFAVLLSLPLLLGLWVTSYSYKKTNSISAMGIVEPKKILIKPSKS
jgi:hypothetical protein